MPRDDDHGQDRDPWRPLPHRAGEHLGRDLPPEPSPLEVMELIERLRTLIAHYSGGSYEIDPADPLAREACWALAAVLEDKPVRDPAEVTALWYVARRYAETGASPRRLGKVLEPAVVWLSPADETGLPIRSRFAGWMVRCGGERSRFGPLRAAEIYRTLVPALSGHGVSRARPIEIWQETLTGLSGLCRWAGGARGRHGTIGLEAGLAYARLAAQVGRRAEAVACLGELHRQLRKPAPGEGPHPSTALTLLDIELDLRILDADLPD